MLKKLALYIYLLQRWVLIGETLIKLNICFFIKDDELLEKYNEIGEKVEIVPKKNLIVKLCIMKYLKISKS